MEGQTVNNQVQQPNIPTPSEPKHHSFLTSKLFLITLAIVVIFTIVYAGIYLYLGTQLDKISKPNQTAITFQPSPTPDETANWKTYKNTKYGFGFKYPVDHTPYASADQRKPALIPATPTSDIVKIAAREAMVFCCEPSTLSFSVEITDKKAREWSEEYLKSIPEWKHELPAIKDTTFAGKSAVEANGRGGYGPPYKLIAVPLNASLLVIRQSEDDPLLSEVLSTFKFTDQEGQVVCTQDVKQCSDGSYVSRQPPNCEFAACP